MATVGDRTSGVDTRDPGTHGRTVSSGKGLTVPRVFSVEGVSPYDQVEWDQRTAAIKDERGKVIFEQTNCEVPADWSQLATNVVVSKYFYGDVGLGDDPGKGGASTASGNWSTGSPGRSPTGARRTATSPPTPTPSGFTTS